MRSLFLLFLILTSVSLFAQEGKLLSKKTVKIGIATLKRLDSVVSNATNSLTKVNLYKITYLSEGLKVTGYLIEPKKTGKYPCVIYNRGGNRDDGMMDDTGIILRGLVDLCAAGYVVVGSQYRGNDGGEGKEEFGGKDVNDILNLLPLLAQVSSADTSRIGMFGWSRGGMMTYITLTKTTRIKAAVVGGGLSNLKEWIKDREGIEDNVFVPLIPDYSTNKEQALAERSAVAFADKIHRATPILLMHGSADWRVSPSQSLTLVNRLYEIKHPVRFVLYEGGQHSLAEFRKEYISQLINWFHNYLRDGKSWPSMEPHGE